MIIPPERLAPEVLERLLQEYITREGTDYGAEELSLSAKVARLRPQIARGDVLIVFDPSTESIDLIEKTAWRDDHG